MFSEKELEKADDRVDRERVDRAIIGTEGYIPISKGYIPISKGYMPISEAIKIYPPIKKEKENV